MASQQDTSMKRRRVSDATAEGDDASVATGSSQLAAKRAKVEEQEGQQTSNAEVPLRSLIDLSDVEDQAQLQVRFDAIAKALLWDYNIVVTRPGNKTKVEIMELEFYLQKEGFHEDPFTHGSEEQKIAGRWYFHRAPKRSEDSNRSLTSTTSWRSGSRKGLDLTIGRFPARASDSTAKAPSTSLLRGGVLLRSIRVLGPKPKVVSGPSLLVDEVLLLSGAKEIGDLYNEKWETNTSAFPPDEAGAPALGYYMHLERKDSSPAGGAILTYNSPRIGLDLSHPGTTGPSIRPLHSRIRFLPRSYRYFREPHLLVANGRIQTFVGVLQRCASSLIEAKRKSPKGQSSNKSPEEEFTDALNNPRLLFDICKVMGLKDATAKRYLVDYKNGRKEGVKVLNDLVGPKGKGASSSPKLYSAMMGAFSTLKVQDDE